MWDGKKKIKTDIFIISVSAESALTLIAINICVGGAVENQKSHYMLWVLALYLRFFILDLFCF